MIWIVLLLLALVTGQSTAGSSRAASPAPTYCSPSGDLCYAVEVGKLRPVLRITTVERYFPRYRLCVGASGRETCKSFPIRKRGRSYDSSIPLRVVLPGAAPGRYRATWRLGTRRLGPSLAFRVG